MTYRLLRNDLILKYYIKPNICLQCNEVIHIKDKTKISNLKNRKFCSSSCSATYHLKLRRENEVRNSNYGTGLKYYCECGEERSRRAKTCKKCFRSLSGLEYRTLNQMLKSYIRLEQAFIAIRKNSRYKYTISNKPKYCTNCGYDKHYQVCHIKAISEFDDSTLIKEINDLDNLIALCPNCHWELDNGLLKL